MPRHEGKDRKPGPRGDRKPFAKRSYGKKPYEGGSGDKSGDKTGDRPARRPSGPRSDRPRSDRPRSDRPRGDRDERGSRDRSEGGERRPYSKGPRRDFGDRKDFPRKDFRKRDGERDSRDGDRDGGRPPRRSYGDRSDRGDRPYTPRAPRKDYGDRGDRPYSARPPRRDRDERDRGERPYTPRRPRERDDERTERAFKSRDIEAKTFGGDREETPALKVSLYGVHAVREAWLNPRRKIKALYLSRDGKIAFQDTLEAATAAGLERPEPTLVAREAIDRALPRDAVHQGIALDAAELEESFIQDLINATAEKEKAVIVILDQVTDPHNVGAILRSACAFGADGVVMQRRHAPELQGVLTKTASGATEHIPVAYETNLSRSIEALQEAGYTVAGLDERGTETLESLKQHQKLVLVMGAEGLGLRHQVKEHCNVLVSLPVSGPIKSLNVSNAAAVALYAVLG